MQKPVSDIAERGGSGAIAQLIQQYCPDGVEYVPIWSLTAWDKKFNGVEKSKQTKVIKYNYLLAADLKSYQVENGTVKLLTTNISNLYTTEELSDGLASDGEVVAIPWGGNPIVQYYKGRFLTADNRIATSLDTNILNNKFLYYCMLSQMKLIASFYRGSGIKHPEMSKVLDLEIPLPPLPVQEAIVNILDRFAEYTAELQAELQARQQQYNYYRDTLLSFEGREDVQWKKLGEIEKCHCSGSTPTKSKKEYYDNGTIPWLRTQDVKFNEITEVDSFITEVAVKETSVKWIPENCVIVAISGATAGRCAINKIKTTTNQHCLNIEIDDRKALYKYVFYCVCNQFDELISLKQGARGDLNSSSILNVKIPVPSLSEQQRIVNILDRFDRLINDLSQGLPAEIEAREQQYEYYRDQLLTFKKKEA